MLRPSALELQCSGYLLLHCRLLLHHVYLMAVILESRTAMAEFPTRITESSTPMAEFRTAMVEFRTAMAEFPTRKAESGTAMAEFPTRTAESRTAMAEFPTRIAESRTAMAEFETRKAESRTESWPLKSPRPRLSWAIPFQRSKPLAQSTPLPHLPSGFILHFPASFPLRSLPFHPDIAASARKG